MHRYTKLLLTSLTATAILAMAVSSATAAHLSVSNQNFRTTWTSLRFNAAGSTILCPVTLEGSFHSATIAKTSGLLIGYITRASVNGARPPCVGGTATVRTETLPWHIRYRSFTGTLPNISGIVVGLIGASFRVQPEGSLACNATTTATSPSIGTINVNTTTHVAESLTPDPTARIPLEEGFCVFAGSGSFEETSQSLTVLGSTTRITVTLI